MTMGSSSPPQPGEFLESRAQRVAQFRLLWEHRRWLLRRLLLGFVLSAAVALLIPARFESTAQIMPPDNQSGSGMAMLTALAGGKSGALGGIAGDLLGAKNSGALFVGILESRTVQDRLIGEFNLQKVYRERKIEDARTELISHTRLSEDRKSGIISVTVTDHDPKRCAAMAQSYVNALDVLVAQVSTSAARRERIFLEERLRAVKLDLDGAAQKFSLFASKNTAIDIPAQSKAMVEAAAVLQGQMIAAESELRGLEAMYTDQNVRVRALRARVAELRAQLGKLGGDGSSFGGSSADASFYPSIRQLPLLGVTYADLFRQTKIQETVFELLTQQYELAKVQEAKEIPSVKVLDAAVVPTKKSFPPRPLFTAAGTVLALACACAWIFLKKSWHEIDPEDPGKQFAIEVAGTIHAEALRLAPVGAAFMQAFRRIKPSAASTEPPAEEPAAEKRESSASAELARAARNSVV
jgi:capsule polysaccharide export protein KpsE/RkpR